MNKKQLENKICLLRDERTRNGWNEAEANEHQKIMSELKKRFPESEYCK